MSSLVTLHMSNYNIKIQKYKNKTLMKKRLLLLSAALICGSVGVSAQSFEYQGNTYTPIDNTHAEFTKYSTGNAPFQIPVSVTDESGKSYTVTSVGDKAFSMKFSITNVVLGDSIKKIGKQAFYYSMLKSVTLDEQLDTIADQAFVGTGWYLTSVNLPKNIHYFGDQAFYSVYMINSPIYIVEGAHVGSKAFYGCNGITELNIMGNPSSVGEQGLATGGLITVNCQTATPPSFSASELVTDESEFDNMVLNVPTGAKAAYQADASWSKFGEINEVDFSKPVIDQYATWNIKTSEAGTVESLMPEEKYRSRVKRLNVSGNINGTDLAFLRDCGVDSLDLSNANIVAGGDPYYFSQLGTFYTEDNIAGQYLFYDAGSFSYIAMPNSVVRVEESAFDGQATAKEIRLGENTAYIGDMAFSGCSSLESFTMPNSVDSIGEMVFATCSNLKNVSLSNNLKKLPQFTFYFCKQLDHITIPASLNTIADQAFFDCESLSNIDIPSTVLTIGDGAFNRCYALENINVNESNPNYSSLDGVLLDKNQSVLIKYPAGKDLDEYTIPETVDSICSMAFWGTEKLYTLNMGDNVTKLAESAFYEVPNLRKVTLSQNIKVIPRDCFAMDDRLETAELPKGLTNIGEEAFMACHALTSVVIPKGVTEISEAAFSCCI